MTYVSACCSAAEQFNTEGEPLYCRETGYCARCHDHCEFEEQA